MEWVVFVHLAGQLSCTCGKNYNAGHYMQTFLPDFFVSAMLRGTIDFYHLRPLSTTLIIIAWGSQGQWIAKPLGFIF